MKLSASHVIIEFVVGKARQKCRLVVGGVIEVQALDCLGDSMWIGGGNGLPDKESVYAAALKLVFSDLPPFEHNRLYPDAVCATERGITIRLGDMTPKSVDNGGGIELPPWMTPRRRP